MASSASDQAPDASESFTELPPELWGRVIDFVGYCHIPTSKGNKPGGFKDCVCEQLRALFFPLLTVNRTFFEYAAKKVWSHSTLDDNPKHKPSISDFCDALDGPRGEIYASAIRFLGVRGFGGFDWDIMSWTIEQANQLQGLSMHIFDLSPDADAEFVGEILEASRGLPELQSLTLWTVPYTDEETGETNAGAILAYWDGIAEAQSHPKLKCIFIEGEPTRMLRWMCKLGLESLHISARDWKPLRSLKQSLPGSLRELHLSLTEDGHHFAGKAFSDVDGLRTLSLHALLDRATNAAALSEVGDFIRRNTELKDLSLSVTHLDTDDHTFLGRNLLGAKLETLKLDWLASETLAKLLDPQWNSLPVTLRCLKVSVSVPSSHDLTAIGTLENLAELTITGPSQWPVRGQNWDAAVFESIAEVVSKLKKLQKLSVQISKAPHGWKARVVEASEERCVVDVKEL